MNNRFIERSSNPEQHGANFAKFIANKSTTDQAYPISQKTFTLAATKDFGAVDFTSAKTGLLVTADITGNNIKKLAAALQDNGYEVGPDGIAFRISDVGAKTLVVIGNASFGDARATDATVATAVVKTNQYLSKRQQIIFNMGVALVLKVNDVVTNIAAQASAAAARTALVTPLTAGGATYVKVDEVDGSLVLTVDAPNTKKITINGTGSTLISKIVSFN